MLQLKQNDDRYVNMLPIQEQFNCVVLLLFQVIVYTLFVVVRVIQSLYTTTELGASSTLSPDF